MRESSEMARKKKDESGIPLELLDKLLEDYEKPEDLLGKDGILDQLKKAVMERALGAELTDHLGYEEGDPSGVGSGNSRNGYGKKRVTTDSSQVKMKCRATERGHLSPSLSASVRPGCRDSTRRSSRCMHEG